jgi:hypothetical protein
VTELPEHAGLLPLVTEADTDGITELFTVMVIPEDVAEAGLAQAKPEVIVQVMTSPFARPVVVYVEDVSPEMIVEFLFHWKTGLLPPLAGTAVKVTAAPEHAGFVPAVTEVVTEGTTVLLTVNVILFDTVVAGLAQARFEVIEQFIISPFVKPVSV